MQHTISKNVETQVPDGYTCDRCKTRIHPNDDLEHDGLHIRHQTGYYSPFGDLRIVEIDLCAKCFHEALGPMCRVTSAGL
jgi:hypothetical protein